MRNTQTNEESEPGITPIYDGQVRRLPHAIRLLLSRRDPELAHTIAAELAFTITAALDECDPVRRWDVPAQLDRGLGRARCLQRMVPLAQWRGVRGKDECESGDAAAYLFASISNLDGLVSLPAEAHVFRLWYLAANAADPWGSARRMFGDLRGLPPHQQLAVGARKLDQLDQRSDAQRKPVKGRPEPVADRPMALPRHVQRPMPITALARLQDRSWLLAA